MEHRYGLYAVVLAFSCLLATEATGTPVIPYHYPLFKQCNDTWGSHLMVTKTICAVGCLMSSTSMALNGNGININSSTPVNPGSLNTWLRNNNGYDGTNDFYEEVLPKISSPGNVVWPKDGMHKTNDLKLQTVQLYLEKGRVMIANVMNGSHFVLVTGWEQENEDALFVNDPGFNLNNYSYSQDVVGWRIFDMEGY